MKRLEMTYWYKFTHYVFNLPMSFNPKVPDILAISSHSQLSAITHSGTTSVTCVTHYSTLASSAMCTSVVVPGRHYLISKTPSHVICRYEFILSSNQSIITQSSNKQSHYQQIFNHIISGFKQSCYHQIYNHINSRNTFTLSASNFNTVTHLKQRCTAF